MAQGDNEHADGRRGFRGPRCWLVTALIGAAIGLIGSWIAPPSTAAGVEAASRPGVIETRPDGTTAVIVPLPDAHAAAPAAPVAKAQARTPLWLCVPFA